MELKLVVEARFLCAVCGKEAGQVALYRDSARTEIRRRSFTSELTLTITALNFKRIERAISAGDVLAVHAMDPEIASFYCPVCHAIYCEDHWTTWDVFDEDEPSWHDSIRGRCPQGHERMLED